jgi:thioredoxin
MLRWINLAVLLISLIFATVFAFAPFSRTIIAHRSVTIATPAKSIISARNFNILRQGYKTFDEFLASVEVPVLVDFYAEWCGPCRMMKDVLEVVASRFDGVARIAKVDTDKSPKLGSKYQVEALPTLILFHKGEVIERFVGYHSADDLEVKMKAAMTRICA